MHVFFRCVKKKNFKQNINRYAIYLIAMYLLHIRSLLERPTYVSSYEKISSNKIGKLLCGIYFRSIFESEKQTMINVLSHR